MKLFVAISLTAALAGCGSSVKLDDVPVEDKSGSRVTQGSTSGAGAQGSGGTAVGSGSVTQSAVAPVDLNRSPPNTSPGASAAKVIYFDYDSYVIKPEFQSVVDAHARYMVADKTRKMSIEGHTDEIGGREYNLALGQKRAEAVRRALGLLGVVDAQMEAVSFGKEKPATEGTSESAFAKNRRAEIAYR